MNIVTVTRGAKIDPGGMAKLSQIFPPDTYGFNLKYIDVLVPPGHTFILKSMPATGWNYTGVNIEMKSGSGDTHIYRITCTGENEAGTVQTTWINHEVTWQTNEFLYFIGYY
jgi:hypothetical protein